MGQYDLKQTKIAGNSLAGNSTGTPAGMEPISMGSGIILTGGVLSTKGIYEVGTGTNSAIRINVSNVASGLNSVALGGTNNNVSGDNSGILAGSGNVLTHDNSFLLGSNLTSTAINTTMMENTHITGSLGIGIHPAYKLHIEDGDTSLIFDIEAAADDTQLQVKGGDDDLTGFLVATTSGAGMQLGTVGVNHTSFPGYGAGTDSFIYANAVSDWLNIINSTGGTSDNIGLFAGKAAGTGVTADLMVSGSGANKGWVGIGTNTPTEELDVVGDTMISGSLGVGTTPGYKLHIKEGNNELRFDGSAVADVTYTQMIGEDTDLVAYAVSNGSESISMGLRGINNTTYGLYGAPADGYVIGGTDNEAMNFIMPYKLNSENAFKFFAGQYASVANTPTMAIFGVGSSYSGNVGINTKTPAHKLEVIGDGKVDSLYLASTPTTAAGNDNLLVRNATTGIIETRLASGIGGSGTVTSVATGTGLSGGPITTSGTINLDIPGLVDLSDAGVLAAADTFAVYNASAAAHEEATITQLQTYMQNNLTLGTGDVSGPLTSIDNHIPTWDGTSGDTLQSSPWLVTTDGTLAYDTGADNETLVKWDTGMFVFNPATGTEPAQNLDIRFLANSGTTLLDLDNANTSIGLGTA
jgi:hypothetical protein